MILCRPQVKVTDYSGPPVTLAELREHGRIGATQVDAEYLQFLLDSASAAAEAYTDRVFLHQTREAYYPWFEYRLQLPGAPLNAVSKVEYRDAAGVYQTLSSSVYTVETRYGRPGASFSWRASAGLPPKTFGARLRSPTPRGTPPLRTSLQDSGTRFSASRFTTTKTARG